MDIKIVDSHLREYLKTKAKPDDIARALSLTSASVEKIEKCNNDFVYSIEVTTNRVDMLNVVGIAREAAASLPQSHFPAAFVKINPPIPQEGIINDPVTIINNDRLVKRICAIALEINLGNSPQFIKDRLEAAGIRSLNNVIDVTNYVMLEVGHPTHVFDYDRLTTKKLIIREAKKGEKLKTLDDKEYTLLGGDIVADNGKGEIIDLLGVMGTANSVVTDQTKKILFFIDNNDPIRIRKTSMTLGIRTDAAIINEKNVDPELAITALLRGIQLYQQVAKAKIASDIIDIYPEAYTPKTVSVSSEKIDTVIGIHVSLEKAAEMLENLGFIVNVSQAILTVTVPSWRSADIKIPEDVIEEIARMYGYYNLPAYLPSGEIEPYHIANEFYFEKKVKEALKYWGFTEVYTYSMVSETLLDGPTMEAVALKNPLDEAHVYMRNSLTPSLLEVIKENKRREDIKIFEISNTYEKRSASLPEETRKLAFVINGFQTDYYHAKGIVEQLMNDLGIKNVQFEDLSIGGLGANIYIDHESIGYIEVLEHHLIDCELSFDLLLKHATLKKIYKPISKYPPYIEDLSLILDKKIKTGSVIQEIYNQSTIITDVTLLDQYESKRTFHIIYQDKQKNLSSDEIAELRKKIVNHLQTQFNAKIV